jgi:tetratricopeptide (TPR) repeat protein
MEDRLGQADLLVGVFSDNYCDALYSQSERWAAFWQDPGGRSGFLVPIEVNKVTKWPVFVEPLNRLSLVGRDETEATKRLRVFLEPRKPPSEKPAFPGSGSAATSSSTPFTEGSEPLGSNPPSFPADPPVEMKSKETASPITLVNPEIRCIDDYEPKPQIFGRDDEIETIVNRLLENKTILVAGGPGMGKTAIATAAFYDSRIVARFDRRRVFASLETATEPRAILAKLVESLGLPPTGDEATLLRILQVSGAEQPLAAILDNAETVFDVDRSASERLLNLVAQIQSISLLVTIRGVAPHVPSAIHIDDLPKLNKDAAHDAFLAIAGNSFKDDPNLPNLLHILDGHALSIRLVAAQAIGSPSLAGLQESWDEVHAEMRRISGEEESRLTSVRASLALSLNSKRMKATPLARRLMALLALLPGGLPESDAHSLLGERGVVTKVRANEAVVCLHQLRLVEKRPDRRLRMLTPLRECVKIDVPPMAGDKKRIVDHYLGLAESAVTIGRKDWDKSGPRVHAEADNLDSICGLAVATNISHRRLGGALDGLAKFYVFSGRGGTRSIDDAVARVRTRPLTLFAANCIRRLGDIAGARRNYEIARLHYNEALPLFKHFGSILGEANCFLRLGDIAKNASDRELTFAFYERALALYRRVGDVLGEANCVNSLGDISRRDGDEEAARRQYENALALCERIGNINGEANCILELGDITRACGNPKAASALIERALTIHRRVGAVGNQANCIKSLGDIARDSSDREAARRRYEEARTLYRSVGDLGGEAEATIRLGQLQMIDCSAAQGLANIEAGFNLYFKISNLQDRALSGWQAMHRALTCCDKDEAQKYQELARSSWTSIGRLDLVVDWIDKA